MRSLGSMKRSCSSPGRRCLAKRMHGKSAAVVLRWRGNEHDPVFDSLAPVTALAHALWDGWGVHHGKVCQDGAARAAQKRAPWTAVKGPFGAAVATLKSMYWRILKHNPFLWCMHVGRIVDPRRVCPHSMHTLLKKAARAWQWRRVALHEGYEGLDRGAVVAPLFAAQYSPWLSAQEQAYLRSVVVDGQWTQQREYRAAETFSQQCALCSSEEGSLIHRHFRCSDGEPSNMLGPFHAAVQSSALWEHESLAARAATSPQMATARVHSALRNSMGRRSQSVHSGRLRRRLGLRRARCGLVRGRLGFGGAR